MAKSYVLVQQCMFKLRQAAWLPAFHRGVLSLSLLSSCIMVLLLGPAAAALGRVNRPQHLQHLRKRQLVVPAQHSQFSKAALDNAGQLAARATMHYSYRLCRTAACIGN